MIGEWTVVWIDIVRCTEIPHVLQDIVHYEAVDQNYGLIDRARKTDLEKRRDEDEERRTHRQRRTQTHRLT